jgi:hypothetical protein
MLGRTIALGKQHEQNGAQGICKKQIHGGGILAGVCQG